MAVSFGTSSGNNYTGANNDGLPDAKIWTATCWVYLTTDRNDYSNAFAISDGTNYLSAGFGANGSVRYVGWEGGDLPANAAPTDATAAAWTRLAVVCNGNTVTLYWGDQTGSLLTRSATGIPPATPTILYIGTDQWGSWLNGRVAGFKLWEAALTSGEVAEEFLQFDPVRTTNLLRYHRFKTANTADDSGNGWSLTAVGSPATAADPVGIPESLFTPRLFLPF